MAFQDCLSRITRAAGRALTDDELHDVITRVQREVASLARAQGFASLEAGMPEIAALPPGLIRDAATKAAKEMIHEAQKKRQRVALTIIAHEKIKADLAELEFRKVSGELVDRSEVRRASATALATLAQGLRSVRDIVERKYNVSPEIADAIGKEIDDALDNLATAFEKMCAAPTTDIEIDDSEDLFADD